MAVDGSITIETKLDSGLAEKDLVALHGSIKKAASAMESIGRSSQRAFDAARLKVEETKMALDRLEEKEREIQAQKIQDLGSMPYSKDQLHDAVESSLTSDKEYQKLQAQIEKTALKLDQYTMRMNEAKDANQSNAASLAQVRESMARAGAEVKKTGTSTQKTAKEFKKMKEASVPLAKSLLSVGRMFQLMLLRMAMRAVVQAARQGFRDLAQYSAEFNQSMSALSTSMLQVRNGLATAVAPALQAVIPLVVSAANAFASLLSVIGMLSARVFGNATTFTKAKKAQVDYAKSVSGATKEMKGQLAAFDELNVLEKKDQGGAAAGTPAPGDMFEEVAIPDNILTIGDTIRKAFEGLAELLGPAKVALAGLWEELQRLGGFAWEGLQDFYNLFLKPVGTWALGEGLPRLIAALADGMSKVDWGKINGSLRTLWEALTPFAINVGEGLLWLWENVLVPLGTWTLNEVVPRFLDLLAAALKVLNGVVEALKPLGKWLWEEFLKPMAEWTGDKILEILDDLIECFEDVSKWISENQATVETFAIILGSFAAAWGLVTLAVGIWNVVGAIATGVTSAFGAAIAFLTSPIGIVIIIIGALIAIIVLLAKNWETVKEVAAMVMEKIKKLWEDAVKWLKDGAKKMEAVLAGVGAAVLMLWNMFVKPTIDKIKALVDATISFLKTIITGLIDYVVGVFTGLIDFIVGVFTGDWERAWQGISNILKGIWNGMVALVEGGVNLIIDAVNWLIRQLNKFKIRIPNARIFGELAGMTFGFDFSELSKFELPRLATGAVIPPNAEFLAILGDQKHGRNIEAPEGLIRQIMREEMGDMGGRDITIKFDGNMSQFVRVLRPYIVQEETRMGKALIHGV